MKGRVLLTIFLFLCFSVLLSQNVFPQQTKVRLPDLTVKKIGVNSKCELVVTVKNLGPGKLPGYVYSRHHPKSAGVYVYINGNGWGGQSIWKFDSMRKLQNPGGQADCVLRYRVTTPASVKAVVDLHNDVREMKENNNELIRTRLSCSRPGKRGPDLKVTDIRLVKDCKIQVTVKNVGNAGVPASYYNLPKAVGVQMYKNGQPWGGIILSGFDPAGKLKSPGGSASHIWFPSAANLNLGNGVHSLKVVADHLKVMPELNENNNSLTRRVKCKKRVAQPGGIVGTPVPGVIRNNIAKIRLSPESPASLDFNEKVKIWFKYSTRQADGVYIFCRPMTKGALSGNYAAHPSKLYPRGKGSGDGYFTITSGPKTVDQVRLRMMNKAQNKVLHEELVNVKYMFPKLTRADKTPKRFFVDFNDAYLAYVPSSKSIQIITQGNVLSYGGDWQKCNMKPYLYHLKQKFWKGFYWKVNTSRKEVYRVKGGQFCKLGGTEEKLNIKVDVVGGGALTPPQRFFLRFNQAYLVYVPATKSIQITTENNVLSYGSDWDKCNMKSYLYHLRLKTWQGFYWKVNTSRKQAWRITGGNFCNLGGSEALLNVNIRVVH